MLAIPRNNEIAVVTRSKGQVKRILRRLSRHQLVKNIDIRGVDRSRVWNEKRKPTHQRDAQRDAPAGTVKKFAENRGSGH